MDPEWSMSRLAIPLCKMVWWYKRMKKHKKSLFIVIIISSLIGGLFWYYHPTHYQYNDRFIVGRSLEQITLRYGEFDKVFYADSENKIVNAAGYLVQQEKQGFLGTSWKKYYMIVFDSTGIAVSVSIEVGSWGG